MLSIAAIKFYEVDTKRRLAARDASEFKKNGDLILWSWLMRKAKQYKKEQLLWGSRIIAQSC